MPLSTVWSIAKQSIASSWPQTPSHMAFVCVTMREVGWIAVDRLEIWRTFCDPGQPNLYQKTVGSAPIWQRKKGSTWTGRQYNCTMYHALSITRENSGAQPSSQWSVNGGGLRKRNSCVPQWYGNTTLDKRQRTSKRQKTKGTFFGIQWRGDYPTKW